MNFLFYVLHAHLICAFHDFLLALSKIRGLCYLKAYPNSYSFDFKMGSCLHSEIYYSSHHVSKYCSSPDLLTLIFSCSL